MAKRGPKLKLNKTLQKNICDDIKQGVPMTHAAVMNGIHKTTFYDWINKGKEETSGVFRDFYQAVEEAKSVAIGLRVKRIYQAGETNWQSDAWWLERVDPEHFGRKDRVQLDANAKVESKSFDNLIRAFEESKKEWKRRQEEESSSD